MKKYFLFVKNSMATANAALLLILVSGSAETAQVQAATPGSMTDAYRADTAYFYDRVKEVHPNLYRVNTVLDWDSVYQELTRGLDDASFSEFVVSISSFAALAGDGHKLRAVLCPDAGIQKTTAHQVLCV